MSLKSRVADARSPEQPLAQPVKTFRVALVASHLGMLLVYPLVRYLALQQDWSSRYARVKSLGELQALEMQGVLCALFLIGWKGWRARNLYDLLTQTAFYLRAMVALATCALDVRLGAMYLMLWWVVRIMLPKPLHELRAASIDVVPLDHLVELTTTNNDVTLLVLFFAERHDACYSAAGAFRDAADKYASPKLRFIAFDACFWPGAAKDFKVDSTTWSSQIPSVLAFQGGKEVRRLPTKEESEDNMLRRGAFSAKDIIRRFELEKFAAKGTHSMAATPPSPERKKSKQKA